MLTSEERQKFLLALRKPDLSALVKKGIIKKINEKCKKAQKCPHCKSINGTCMKI